MSGKHAIGSGKLERVQVFYINFNGEHVIEFILLCCMEDMVWLHNNLCPVSD